MENVKIYRKHYCSKKHRTYLTIAKCLWKRAHWLHGDGPYALLAHCRVLTITLHHSYEAAKVNKDAIDKYACGGVCNRRHEIIKMLAPADIQSE